MSVNSGSNTETNGAASGPLSGVRLLIAEDDKNTARLLLDFLCARGATVRHVSTGTEAIMMTAAEPYDFIMVDLRLPGENGFMVMERIREQDRPPIIIAMSAFYDKQNRVRSLESGAHAFFSKPIDLQELALIIGNLNALRQSCLRNL